MLNKELNNITLNDVICIRKENFVFRYNLKNEIKDIKKYVYIFIDNFKKEKYFKNDYKILNDEDVKASYIYKIFKKSKIIIYTLNKYN